MWWAESGPLRGWKPSAGGNRAVCSIRPAWSKISSCSDFDSKRAMQSLARPSFTPEEYLAMERQATHKDDYRFSCSLAGGIHPDEHSAHPHRLIW